MDKIVSLCKRRVYFQSGESYGGTGSSWKYGLLNGPMINDFIEYWTAARLLLSGGNPYSPEQLLQAQQALGWTQPIPLFMWNPPWTLAFIFPIGWLDYGIGQSLWFVLHVLIVFVGAQLLWEIYRGDHQRSRYSWLSVLTFAPTYFVLLLGQISPLVLLGLIAFLCFAQRERWGYAGASLALAGIKPHLLYLLWLTLILWLLKEKQWRAGVGLLVAGITVAVTPLVWSVQIYGQYLQLLQDSQAVRPLGWATPSFGTVIAELFTIRGAWIRWMPSVAGVLWLLWYWSHKRETWEWCSQVPVVLLASVVTASFAWTFDYVVLMPALIQGAVWTSRTDINRRRLIVGMHVLISATAVVSKIFVKNDFWYFWLAPAYLLLYFYARPRFGRPCEN